VSQGKLPKINFPVFNGDNPQLWHSRCQNYFDMYGVEPSLWVRVMSMHVEGIATRWLQSVERRLHSVGWTEFCAMVHERFGYDQHEALIHQLFHIRQSGIVTKYVEQFSTLVDQLAAYESQDNPIYYAMCFVDGLRDDIKSMAMIQRLATFDTTCALALVQEEAVDSRKRREYRRYEHSFNRAVHNPALSLPSPVKLDKPTGVSVADDKRTTEAARASTLDDKVRALKQYMHARGLCNKCVEKWSYGHKCFATVLLHAIQELWEMFYC
jgi:hypothetical protein